MRLIPMLMQASNDLTRRGHKPLNFDEICFIISGIHGYQFAEQWKRQVLSELETPSPDIPATPPLPYGPSR